MFSKLKLEASDICLVQTNQIFTSKLVINYDQVLNYVNLRNEILQRFGVGFFSS